MAGRRACVALLFFFSLPLRAAVVTTVAGNGTAGFTDGVASTAQFNRPTWLDIVPDERPFGAGTRGDIYVTDRANRAIRKISNGVVSTYHVARNYVTDRTELPFDFGGPFGGGIVIEPEGSGCGEGIYDRGFFVSVTGSHQIVLVSFDEALADRDSGVIVGTSKVAGIVDGSAYAALFNSPTGVSLSPNYPRTDAYHRWLDVADTGNNVIRRIRFGLSGEGCPRPYDVITLAGIAGQSGSRDGAASAALFNGPRGIIDAPDGSVYVTDTGNHTIRRISPDGIVTTIAGEAGVRGSNDGPASETHFDSPSGIAVAPNGSVIIADTGNHTIRALTTNGFVVTIAGQPGVAGFADGVNARFNGPVGVKVAPDESIYVADTSNNAIRRIIFPGRRHASKP